MKIFVISGEHSGDLHASAVIQELYTTHSNVEIIGWGGYQMEKAGMTNLLHIHKLSTMGFSDVIKRVPFFLSLLAKCKQQIENFVPDAILLVDFSGFNLRIAKWAKRKGIKVHFYIAPKTWAYREGRNRMIAQSVDFLHCIFPFEEKYFKNAGINAQYVGNPLMTISERHVPNDKKEIAVLPGSRIQELKCILPVIDALIAYQTEYKWIVSKVPHISKSIYEKYLSKESRSNIFFSEKSSLEILASSSLALITSGTASLEAAVIGCPQIVMYKTSALNHWIGKRLIKTNFISLPNILLNSNVVRELIQNNLNLPDLKRAIDHLILRKNQFEQKKNYEEIKSLLGLQDPRKIVAKSIIKSTYL